MIILIHSLNAMVDNDILDKKIMFMLDFFKNNVLTSTVFQHDNAPVRRN